MHCIANCCDDDTKSTSYSCTIDCGSDFGIGLRNSVEAVTESWLSGFGNTLKWIGLVILLGVLPNEVLAIIGGKHVNADNNNKLIGER